MKKLLFAAVLVAATLASCSGNKDDKQGNDSTKKDTAASASANPAGKKYHCEMGCEGNKTYDAPGKCPSCGMDMKEVK